MPRILNSAGFKFTRAVQISESHCGPAVLQMLLSNIGFEINQKEIAKAANIGRVIRYKGMRIDQMDKAIRQLKLPVTFWYRSGSTISDIENLLHNYHLPVGVEWQGLFDLEWEEDPDEDYGHYSVVIQINRDLKKVIFVDPYKDFAHRNRAIAISKFEKRWWDINETEPVIGSKANLIRDDQMLFVITLSDFSFPPRMEMRKF